MPWLGAKHGIVWLVSDILVLVAGGMSRIAETAEARETVKKGVLTKLEVLNMTRMISPPCGS